MGTTEALANYQDSDVTVYASSWDDVDYLAMRLRTADRQEVRAATGNHPRSALAQGLKLSDKCFTVLLHGDPVIMAGVITAELDKGLKYGSVWMLGTPEIQTMSRLFIRHCRGWLTQLEEGHDLVGNVVDARNLVHIRWIKWLGFSFLRRLPKFGHEQRPFMEFLKIV